MQNGEHAGQHGYRSAVLMAVIALAFLVIAVKLYIIQIADHEEYVRRSEQNAMRTVPIEAVRGRLLDRDGNIIVGNRPAYTVGVIPAEVQDVEYLDSVIAPVTGVPRQTLIAKVRGRHRRLHRPIELSRDTPFRTIAYLEEHRHQLPGIVYFVESRRRYPYGRLGAHLLGYVREVRESQLNALKPEGYSLGDLMGQSGVEATYEEVVRGVKGEEYQEITASGRVVQSQRREPVRGSDVRLTIDLGLQQVAEAAMDTIKRGALVAMDPRNGEILAMVSRPTFDPDVFSFVVPPEVWRQLNDDEERPLFNRVTMGTYPPGSTAKMISAISALENGILDTTTRLRPCTGTLWYGNRPYRCWAGRGHGSLNLIHAIEASCNIFFYQVGERVGIDRWGATARKFGLGQPTGVDLPTEESGIAPSNEAYHRKFGRYRWGRGEALNVGIGQGITLVTPLQMVRYVAALGTGYLVTPHVALSFLDPDGTERLAEFPKPVPVAVDSSLLAIVRGAMILVTEGSRGTAHRSRVPGFKVAGKTGTAENPHGEDHSWYVGYVPAQNPVIAIAVICENAGHGSDIAAPIAGAVFRARLLRQERPEQPEGVQMVQSSDPAPPHP